MVIFALAVRIFFTRILTQKLTEHITASAQFAAANAEVDEGSLKIGDDFYSKDLTLRHQGLQWFDPHAKLCKFRLAKFGSKEGFYQLLVAMIDA